MTKKEITETEKEIIKIELEKSRLNREKSILVMEKGMFLYFSFIFIAVIGFVNGYVNKTLLNTLTLLGLAVLIIALIPYIAVMTKEQKKLNVMIEELKRK